MLKNTVTGSILAKLLPATVAKHFLENASQDEVNKAEQEAAVLHQQMQSGVETTPPAPATPVAAVPAAPATPAAPVTGPTAAELTSQLTAMSTRATTAESQVASLTTQLATSNQDLARYKAWHDKHKTLATALPAADALNKDDQQDANLSTASSSALAQFRKVRGIA
ncbi:hypothetical protein GCM10028819_32250 [Spirosoma humi]